MHKFKSNFLRHMMNDDKMSSSDGVEISSDILFGRGNSMKMASPQVNALLRKSAHDDHAALRDDEESVASSVSSSKMARCRGKSKAETNNRRHVFDELTKVKLNTSLAHPGRGEMWFGDLDFDFDINGEWVQDTCKRGER
mmetsp:Transcript_7550/g.12681  ORF Transcript_7550/g.12681 Transcript_7550/m.12681 type:complete len:140 (-) Transcript_7550:278-697(-)